MYSIFKKIALIGLVLGLTQISQAQVKFNLSLMPDQRTYLVSMIPETTWMPPQNTVGSIQIVLKMPADKAFLAGEIKSLIPGISWSDNAYIERPSSAKAYTFVCFVLNEPGTKKIPFDSGVETPLFTFINLETGCVGSVELVENESEIVKSIVQADRINVTQNITVLGARGNAFSGILNSTTDCTLITSTNVKNSIVKNLRIFPVPASDYLHVYWNNDADGGANKISVSNMLGEIIAIENTNNVVGEQKVVLDVAGYSNGLYTAVLSNSSGERQTFRFIITHL
jgi:hypothetical protein